MKHLYLILRNRTWLILAGLLWLAGYNPAYAQQCYPEFYLNQLYPYGSLCSPQNVTLRAEYPISTNTNTYGEFRWYATETAASPVQTGYIDGLANTNDYYLYAQQGTTIWVSYLDYNTWCETYRVAYTFNISPAPSLSIDYSRACGDGTASIQLSGAPSGATYYLYKLNEFYDPNNGSSSPYVLEQSSSTGQFAIYNFNPQDYDKYYAQIYQPYGCSTPYYYQLYIDVADPSPPAVSGNLTVYKGGSITLIANTSSNYDIRWYNAAGTLVQEGTEFSTPFSLTAGTYTYTARGVSYSGCLTNPATVTLTVSPVPGTNYNFITSNTILEEGKKTEADLVNLNKDQRAQRITYFDGLGREMQTVATQGSPLGKDVVQPVGYDDFGRQDKKYLPYVKNTASNGFYKPDAIKTTNAYSSSEQYLFYQVPPGGVGSTKIATDGLPYAKTVFEASPLGRVQEQGAPGTAFQPGTNRTVKITERNNVVDEVRRWVINPNSYSSPGFYDANELYVTETRDEHDNLMLEFKDKQGKVVLKQLHDGSGMLSTYYLYDDFGNLRLVMQPEGAKKIAAGTFTPDAAFISNWCFTYRYDGRNRLVEKSVPGGGKTLLLYDKRDRLVLTQDENQRSLASAEWSYTKYDELNRPAETGSLTRLCVHTGTTRY